MATYWVAEDQGGDPGNNLKHEHELYITGDVGIGTTNPAKKLDIVVADDTWGAGAQIRNSDGSMAFLNGAAGSGDFTPTIKCDASGALTSRITAVSIVAHRYYRHVDYARAHDLGVESDMQRLDKCCTGAVRRALDFFKSRRRELTARYRETCPAVAALDSQYSGYYAFMQASALLGGSDVPTAMPESRHAPTLWPAIMFLPIIENPGITAVVSPNDMTARVYLLPHLASQGKQVPADVSIVSFDNKFRTAFFPLTTVDFGLGPMGHVAFSILAGQYTVRRRERAMLAGKPYVVHRGTIAPPR